MFVGLFIVIGLILYCMALDGSWAKIPKRKPRQHTRFWNPFGL